MSRVCETWSLDELGNMDDDLIETLLTHYNTGDVPRLRELRPKPQPEPGVYEFDGSFGWWI